MKRLLILIALLMSSVAWAGSTTVVVGQSCYVCSPVCTPDTTVNLAPNAAGDVRELNYTASGTKYTGDADNYTRVDEIPSDAAAAVSNYASGTSTWQKDLYNIATPAAGTWNCISKITVKGTFWCGSSTVHVKYGIKISGTEYWSDEYAINVSSGWTLHAGHDWICNPYSNQPWSKDDMTDLQIGVSIRSENETSFGSMCDNLYCVVSYDAE